MNFAPRVRFFLAARQRERLPCAKGAVAERLRDCPFPCNTGVCSFLSGSERKEAQKKALAVFSASAIPCRCCCGKPQQVDISPRSFADKAVSTRHSANNAALRQMFYLQTFYSRTHRVPIISKIYLMRHAFHFRLELDGSLPISDGRFCCCKIEKPKERCDDVLIGGK